MATMKDVKDFFEEGQFGVKVPMTEVKELTDEDREDLKTLLDQYREYTG